MNSALIDRFQSAQTLENILFSMRDGMLVVTSGMQIALVNRAAIQQLGYVSAEDLTGRALTAIVYDQQNADALIGLLEATGRLEDFKSTLVTQQGQTLIVSCSGFKSKDELTSAIFYIILFYDISYLAMSEKELSKYTRQLEKTNQDLDEFVHIVSHDLKAPLRAISNLSIWLQEDLGEAVSGDSVETLMLLRNRVGRMEELINGILEYSKAGRQSIKTENVDVSLLLQDVIELLNLPPHIKVETGADLPILETPRVLLFQVFSNLIGNAIKYNNKESGVVSVHCHDVGPYWEFTVGDNGIGIDLRFAEKIFVIFQTLQPRDKVESTGVGLSIVKRILTAVGGSIRLESVINEGSKFIFTWPKHLPQK